MQLRIPSVIVLVVGLAACSDDGASPDASSLSREEALLLAGAMSDRAEGAATSSYARPSSGDAIASDPLSFTHTLESTFQCPAGGSTSLNFQVTGTVDVAATAFEVDVTGSQKPAACAYTHEGVTLTVDGDPKIDFESHASFAGETAREPITSKVIGGFKWSASDGRTGQCSIDFREVTDLVAKKVEREGTVCGHSIKETFTWT